MTIKPQDILILLKIIAKRDTPWLQTDLADDLAMSRAEVSNALSRAVNAGLLDEDKRTPRRAALLEFIRYGVKYVYAVKPGPLTRGIVTAHSAKPLAQFIRAEPTEKYVWPSSAGDTRGQGVEPLYPTIPKIVQKDWALYEMLTLIDALRLGRVREQKIAIDELTKRIMEV